VLRASNSAAAGGSSRISSVRQAVVLIGLKRIRYWAMLMVIDDVAGASEEQMVSTLARARLSEIVAETFGAAPDTAFMAGLITGVADLLGHTHAAMAGQLPLSADLTAALVDGTGPLGQVLRTVDAYEAGDLIELAGDRPISGRYLDAIRWSSRTVRATRLTPA
jgi:EAL and modified HD-GYP domain-containing signal transduction protein